MSGLISGFDADQVVGGTAIPEGTQATCLAIEAEDLESKSNPGNWMIKLTVEVVDGPFKGTRIWPNFNLRNSNETAQRIGQQQLKNLCLAIGVPRPQSNSELLNKPFRATFGKPQEFNGEQQSQIKKYDPVGGSAGVVQNLGPNQQAASSTPTPSWAKK